MENKQNQVYNLFSKWDFLWAKKINDEILAKEPNNIYAKKYDELIKQKIKGNLSNKNDKIKIKWKILKCPHCLSRIPFSALNTLQKEKIRNWNYNNLEIKCPYCNTKFVLQKKSSPSILWLKIWNIANIENEKYRVVWNVYYEWKWYEWSYSGKLWYLEWILLWENNNYKYFSEGGFYDDWDRIEEFEISEKIIPKFSLQPNYEDNYIIINQKRTSFKEKNIVSVKKVYWENSKVFTIWEKVELYEFSFEWKNYVIEKEKAWNQSEAWIYETKKISRAWAFYLFWKKLSDWNYYSWSPSLKKDNDLVGSLIYFWFIWFFIFLSIVDEFGLDFNYFFYFIWIIFLIYLIYKIFTLEKGLFKNTLIMVILFPIFTIINYFIFNAILETRKEIKLSDIDFAKKIELRFNNPSIETEKVSSRTTYDYWWVRTVYKKNVWLKFSVKDENDKKIIEKINQLISWENTYINNLNEEKIKRMFENWKIYLIKK